MENIGYFIYFYIQMDVGGGKRDVEVRMRRKRSECFQPLSTAFDCFRIVLSSSTWLTSFIFFTSFNWCRCFFLFLSTSIWICFEFCFSFYGVLFIFFNFYRLQLFFTPIVLSLLITVLLCDLLMCSLTSIICVYLFSYYGDLILLDTLWLSLSFLAAF